MIFRMWKRDYTLPEAWPGSSDWKWKSILYVENRLCWIQNYGVSHGHIVSYCHILVGGLVAIFYFPIHIGLLIIPIDFHIFQRGGPTTNQYMLLCSAIVWQSKCSFSMPMEPWSHGAIPSKRQHCVCAFSVDDFGTKAEDSNCYIAIYIYIAIYRLYSCIRIVISLHHPLWNSAHFAN